MVVLNYGMNMFRNFDETFTNDLRFRNEIISLDCEEANLLEEREVQSPEFSQDDIDWVWSTLENLFGKNSNKYIMVYLVFYLGYSYRDAAEVLGVAVAWGFDMVQSAIEKVQKQIKKDESAAE